MEVPVGTDVVKGNFLFLTGFEHRKCCLWKEGGLKIWIIRVVLNKTVQNLT
jgi:hypothetical protein